LNNFQEEHTRFLEQVEIVEKKAEPNCGKESGTKESAGREEPGLM